MFDYITDGIIPVKLISQFNILSSTKLYTITNMWPIDQKSDMFFNFYTWIFVEFTNTENIWRSVKIESFIDNLQN